MTGSSRRSLFLVVFVLALFGLLGMLFAQRVAPASSPSSDSDVRDSLKIQSLTPLFVKNSAANITASA